MRLNSCPMQHRALTRERLPRQQQPAGQRVPNSPLPLVALIQFCLLVPSFLFGHLKQRREGVEASATAERGKDAGNARRMGAVWPGDAPETAGGLLAGSWSSAAIAR